MQNKVVLIQDAIKKYENSEGRKVDDIVVSVLFELFKPKISSEARDKFLAMLRAEVAQ